MNHKDQHDKRSSRVQQRQSLEVTNSYLTGLSIRVKHLWSMTVGSVSRYGHIFLGGKIIPARKSSIHFAISSRTFLYIVRHMPSKRFRSLRAQLTSVPLVSQDVHRLRCPKLSSIFVGQPVWPGKVYIAIAACFWPCPNPHSTALLGGLSGHL